MKPYLISTASTSSESTRIRPQFSQTITFLRCLISLCFWGKVRQILRNGQMLVVESGTLNVTIVDVSYETRTSIQEQYKSILQR